VKKKSCSGWPKYSSNARAKFFNNYFTKTLENANIFFLGTSVCSQNRDQRYFLRQSFAILATKKQGMCRTVALPFTF